MTSTWPAGWYIACRSSDLGARPRAASLAGLHCVLYRDRSGIPRALEDRCAHRGAPLSAGSVDGDGLRCPYHGWRYDRGGRLCEVPALGEKDRLPDAACVPAYDAIERQGYVWLWIGESPPQGEPHVFANLDASGWTHFRMRNRFQAGVEACLENFLDCPHATFVHRGWFRSPTARTVKAVVRTLADGVQAEYFEEPRTGSVVWSLLAPARGTMRHTDRFIAPNLSQVDYAFPSGLHYTITSCCTPIAPQETEVHTVISFRYGRIGPLVRLVFEPLSRIIIRQDVRMLARQGRNLGRFGGREFVSTAADLLGPHIVAWNRALRAGDQPPAAGAAHHVDIRL